MRLPDRVGDFVNLRHDHWLRPNVGHYARTWLLVSAFMMLPASVFASANVARAVETFCAPQPAQPAVSACSTCHSSARHRSVNDLTETGKWASSSATYYLFCPAMQSSVSNQSSTPSGIDTGSKRSSSSPASSSLPNKGRNSIGMGRGAILPDEHSALTSDPVDPRVNEYSLLASLRRLIHFTAK